MWQWPWQKKVKPQPLPPPKVGGTRVPDQVIKIDFSRPHDFHFRLSSNDSVFRHCVLVGFSTPTGDDGQSVSATREWNHDRWLVLRQPDGRLVYVPRDGLQYIEESSCESNDSVSSAVPISQT